MNWTKGEVKQVCVYVVTVTVFWNTLNEGEGDGQMLLHYYCSVSLLYLWVETCQCCRFNSHHTDLLEKSLLLAATHSTLIHSGSQTREGRGSVGDASMFLQSSPSPSHSPQVLNYDHKFEDNLDRTLMWSVSGRLTIESFLGSAESPRPVPTPPTANPAPAPGLCTEPGRDVRGKAPTDIWWGSTTLCAIALRMPAWPDGAWGGPMEVEETRVDWGGLGAPCCAPSWGSEGWEAESALASWLRLPICREWVLLCVLGRCAGLAMCCWTRESWEPEVGPARALDPYWNDRPPTASGLWTGGLDRTGAKAPEARSWDCKGEAETGLGTFWITWNLLTILGDCRLPAPTELPCMGGQKFMATACCRVAIAELWGWVEEPGGVKIPLCKGGVMDIARGRGTSTCWTISRSYLTISWIISFSRLLKTPEFRSCWTLCIRIEFFLPAMTWRQRVAEVYTNGEKGLVLGLTSPYIETWNWCCESLISEVVGSCGKATTMFPGNTQACETPEFNHHLWLHMYGKWAEKNKRNALYTLMHKPEVYTRRMQEPRDKSNAPAEKNLFWSGLSSLCHPTIPPQTFLHQFTLTSGDCNDSQDNAHVTSTPLMWYQTVNASQRFKWLWLLTSKWNQQSFLEGQSES